MDCDGSLDPGQLPLLLAVLRAGQADVSPAVVDPRPSLPCRPNAGWLGASAVAPVWPCVTSLLTAAGGSRRWTGTTSPDGPR